MAPGEGGEDGTCTGEDGACTGVDVAEMTKKRGTGGRGVVMMDVLV